MFVMCYFHLQSIPRTILFDNNTGTNLLQWPVEEIESLRLNGTEFEKVAVKAGSVVPLDVGPGSQVCHIPSLTMIDLYTKILLVDKEIPFLGNVTVGYHSRV